MLSTCGRLATSLLLSFKLIPLSTNYLAVTRFRSEVVLETMVLNTMEYVSAGHGGADVGAVRSVVAGVPVYTCVHRHSCTNP